MKIKTFFATFMIAMLLVAVSMETQAAATVTGRTHEPNAEASMTNGSKKKSKVRKVSGDVKKGTKDTGKAVGNGAEDTGKGVAKGSEKAAKVTADGAKSASKATANGAKATGRATAKGAKKIGRVFK